MSFALQALMIIFCITLLLYVSRLVAQEKLMLKYSLLWLVLAVVLFLAALFPNALFALASLFGFASPSNFIFVIGFFCLIAISLSLTVIVSKQALRIKNLVQRIALLEFSVEKNDEMTVVRECKMPEGKPDAS